MKNRFSLALALIPFVALTAWAQHHTAKGSMARKGTPGTPRVPIKGESLPHRPPARATPRGSRNTAKMARSTRPNTSTTINGMVTMRRTTNAFTSIIPSNTGTSNTLVPTTGIPSSAWTATIAGSGSRVVSTLKLLHGTGLFARTGAGIAVMTSSYTKIPITLAGICSTTFTPVCTYT